MKYVVIEEKLMDPLRKKWKDVITNINPGCWVLHKARRPIDHIQPYLITNMSINSHRARKHIHTQSHIQGIEVSLWNQTSQI